MDYFIIIFLSLIIASFISCLSYRLEVSQGFIFTRSKCIKCEKNLNPISLIPVFSYIFLKGKCYFCNEKISPRYILIEIFFLIFFLSTFVFFKEEFSAKLIFTLIIFSILSLMAIIDIEKYYIPNSLQFLLFLIALIYNFSFFEIKFLQNSIISSLIYGFFSISLYLFFLITTKRRGIGIDDIKFFFVAGFLLGINKFLPFIFLSGLFGIIFGIIWTKLKKDETFPFAPAMCLSCYFNFMIENNFLLNYVH